MIGLPLASLQRSRRRSYRPSWIDPTTVYGFDVGSSLHGWWGDAADNSVANIPAFRNSLATGIDGDGVVRSFGVNAPIILPNRGLYVNGQFTNLYDPSNPASGFGWSAQGGAITAADGEYCRVIDASTSTSAQLLGTVSIPANSSTYSTWVDVKKEEAPTAIGRLYFRLIGGTAQVRALLFDAYTGVYRSDFAGHVAGTLFFADLGDRWRFGVTIQNNGTNTSVQTYWTPSFRDDFNTSDISNQVNATQGAGSFGWPHLIVGSYIGANIRLPNTTPLLATEQTIPNFSALVAVHGLDSGLVVKARMYYDPAIAVTQGVWAFGSNSSNYIQAYVASGGYPRFRLAVGGTLHFTLEAGQWLTAGWKEIVCRAAPGEWRIDATGLAGAGVATAFSMPPLPSGYIGKLLSGAGFEMNGPMDRFLLNKVAA